MSDIITAENQIVSLLCSVNFQIEMSVVGSLCPVRNGRKARKLQFPHFGNVSLRVFLYLREKSESKLSGILRDVSYLPLG